MEKCISAILPSIRTNMNIFDINENLVDLCMKYNFEFIDHLQITTKFLWNDGIHLLNTGKSILGQNFVNRVSNFFSQKRFFLNGSSLSGDHTIDFEIKNKRSSTVVENKFILTTLSNYNSLQKSSSSLFKIGALDAKSRLKEMKAQSSDKLILGHLNINAIRNKFEALKFIIDNNIDIFLISETKLDDSFPTAQFLTKGFSAPYSFDRNSKCGGLLLYIREDIPSKILT